MPPRRTVQQPTLLAQDLQQYSHAPSPNLTYLRTHWKWAAVSQFLSIFFPVIQDDHYTVQAVEDDLADTTFLIIPKIIGRILYTTTLDRRINHETWQIYLRKHFIKRSPETNPFGTEEEPIEWASLSVEAKLDAFHAICEWPFANPTRVRSTMNDEDLNANWRAEPIGYDAKRNAYWFISGERLWIQRARTLVPKPKKAPKKKIPPKNPPKSKAKAAAPSKSSKRKGRQPRNLHEEESNPEPSPGPQTRTRNKRSAPNEIVSSLRKRPRVSGIRSSSRLGALDGDGWQEVPEDWLEDKPRAGSRASSRRSRGKAKADSDGESTPIPVQSGNISALDDGSELTELSDSEDDGDNGEGPSKTLDDEEPQVKSERTSEAPEDENVHHAEPVEEREDGLPRDLMAMPPTLPDAPDFVEWETICVTAQDWQAVAEQFAKSTNTYERSLNRALNNYVIPEVLALFKERERVVRHQEAVVGRKRSSRLALIDAEKEKIKEEAMARAEVDAKMDRSRRMEARERAQVEERERREKEREDRRKEREQKLLEEQEADERESRAQSEALKAQEAKEAAAASGTSSGRYRQKRTKADNATDEKWELDCEVCLKKGWNLVDGKEITCCERCGKWQHTECHDLADDRAGRPRREWSKVDFVCKACLQKNPRKRAGPEMDGTFTPQSNEVPTGRGARLRAQPKPSQATNGVKGPPPPKQQMHPSQSIPAPALVPSRPGTVQYGSSTYVNGSNGVGQYPGKLAQGYPAALNPAYAAFYASQQTQQYGYYSAAAANATSTPPSSVQPMMNGHHATASPSYPPQTISRASTSANASPYPANHAIPANKAAPSPAMPPYNSPAHQSQSQTGSQMGYYATPQANPNVQYYGGNYGYAYGNQYRLPPSAYTNQYAQPPPVQQPPTIQHSKPLQVNGYAPSPSAPRPAPVAAPSPSVNHPPTSQPPANGYPYQYSTPAPTGMTNGTQYPSVTLPPLQQHIAHATNPAYTPPAPVLPLLATPAAATGTAAPSGVL